MLANPATEAELRGLAEEELRAVRARLIELERDVKAALLPKDAADEKNAILEIRGEPAATRRRFSPAIFSGCINATPS